MLLMSRASTLPSPLLPLLTFFPFFVQFVHKFCNCPLFGHSLDFDLDPDMTRGRAHNGTGPGGEHLEGEGDGKGLHLVVPSFDGHIYIIGELVDE